MSHRPRSRRPFAAGWRCLVACLLSLGVILAPVAATLHRAFVPHVVCEHGDLVETSEGALLAMSVSDAPAAERGEASVSGLAADGKESHGHDHCSVGTVARQAHCTHRPLLVLAGQLDETIVLSNTQTALLARSILLNAPKTSPPSPLA